MNARQRAFCEFYAANPNATEAAIKAGFSKRTARSQAQRLLTNVDIRVFIEELQEQLESERIADVKEMREFLTKTMRDENERPAARLKACELLMKAAGVFLNQPEEQNDGGERDDVVIYLPEILREKDCEVSDEA